MKHKIITITALFAVMVALTGAASAFNIALEINGTEQNPLLLKNGQNLLVDLALTNIRPQDLNGNTTVSTQVGQCAGDPNCTFSDVNLTVVPGKEIITITSTPKTVEKEAVNARMAVPLSRKPGTQWVFSATGSALGNPPENGLGTLTVELRGSNISGKKCNDIDRNGICGQGEPGLPGWTINLRNGNGTLVATTQTDANGNYVFSGENGKGLRGDFTVEEVLQQGWNQTGPPSPGTHTVTVDTNDATGLDFANVQEGSISGQKWNDLNGDGIKDASEPRLAGWTITLTKPDATTATAQTDANGNYNFTHLPPGTYTVSETLQAGWTQTAPKPIPPGTYTVNLAGGQNVVDRDFGNRIVTGNISGQKWNDTDGDGIKGASEPRLANWTITLTKPDGSTATTQTDANGNYKFTDLLPGTYTVSETLQAGWVQTFPTAPPTHTVTLSAGQDVTGIDFGNKIPEVLKPGKVVGWGTLGNKAAPELTFKVWAYSSFMPKGTVEAEDDAGNKIVATEIDSVLTDKTVNPKTGEIKGKAMFNNEGPFDFVVKVTDGGQPPSPYVGKDTFDISISAKNYHKSGTLTSGDLEVVK